MGIGYVHLSFEERSLIETQLRLGFRPAAIAAGLSRSRSTVTREMGRNNWKPDRISGKGGVQFAGGYRSIKADRRAPCLAFSDVGWLRMCRSADLPRAFQAVGS